MRADIKMEFAMLAIAKTKVTKQVLFIARKAYAIMIAFLG